MLGAEGSSRSNATALLPATERRARRWQPAWVLEPGRGQRSSPGRRPPHRRLGAERSFVVPAFSLPLRSLPPVPCPIELGCGPGEVPHEPVPGGTLARADAETFARHLVVGEEVARPTSWPR